MRRITRQIVPSDWLAAPSSSRICHACQLRLSARFSHPRARFLSRTARLNDTKDLAPQSRPNDLPSSDPVEAAAAKSIARIRASKSSSTAPQEQQIDATEEDLTEAELAELEELEARYGDSADTVESQPLFSVLEPAPLGEEAERGPDPQAEIRNRYEENLTWDGLEWIGTERQKYEAEVRKLRERWGVFNGFGPEVKVTDPKEVYEGLMKALKEALFLQALGRPSKKMRILKRGKEREVVDSEGMPLEGEQVEPATGSESMPWTERVELVVEQDGGYKTSFANEGVLKEAFTAFWGEDEAANKTLPGSGLTLEGMLKGGPQESPTHIPSPEQAWKTLSIESLTLRFAVSCISSQV